MRKLPENRFLQGTWRLAHRYISHNVGIQSAALAFYLLFAIFPFSIFASALLGQMKLDVAEILLSLSRFLPREVVEIVEMYLTYVAENPSRRLLMFGFVFTLYFPMRAANSLMRSVRTAYRLGPPQRMLYHWLKVLVCTVLLIVTIVFTLALMTAGERLMDWAIAQFRLPGALRDLWLSLRFPAAAVVGFFVLFLLYALAQDSRPSWRNLWPGTLASLAAWMLLSWLYAFYVDRIAHYSALYGSIGTIIVLLIWLYLSAATLIMGAEFNGVIVSMRKDTEVWREEELCGFREPVKAENRVKTDTSRKE